VSRDDDAPVSTNTAADRLVETQKERHPDVGIASLQRAMHSLLANPLFGGDIR